MARILNNRLLNPRSLTAALSAVAGATLWVGCESDEYNRSRTDSNTYNTSAQARYDSEQAAESPSEYGVWDNRSNSSYRDATSDSRAYDDRRYNSDGTTYSRYDNRGSNQNTSATVTGDQTYGERTSPNRGGRTDGARGDESSPNAYATSQNYPTDANRSQSWNDSRRILGFMHRTNQEEVEAGRLAQERGTTQAVRDYGMHLAKDHAANDAKVRSLADRMGMRLDDDAARAGGSSNAANSPLMNELRGLSGSEFDRVFAMKMDQGHRDAIQTVESAVNSVDPDVRSLINDTLPALREHQRRAESLRNDGRAQTASDGMNGR